VHENGKRLKDSKAASHPRVLEANLDGVRRTFCAHTCATWLMQLGVPAWEAAGYLKMTQETLQRYTGIITHRLPEGRSGGPLMNVPHVVRATARASLLCSG